MDYTKEEALNIMLGEVPTSEVERSIRLDLNSIQEMPARFEEMIQPLLAYWRGELSLGDYLSNPILMRDGRKWQVIIPDYGRATASSVSLDSFWGDTADVVLEVADTQTQGTYLLIIDRLWVEFVSGLAIQSVSLTDNHSSLSLGEGVLDQIKARYQLRIADESRSKN